AVPVAVVGTFAGMLALGFSINTLTLFGLVLAIGIVVDDAIIVVENVERLMHEERLDVRRATVKAMQQVTGPVIAIVLVLSAVFVPVAFLGGLTGQMYRQFAITIAVSVAISGFVALTLSPALCTLLLRPSHGRKNLAFRAFDRLFGGFTQGYTAGVRLAIRGSVLTLIPFAALCFAAFRLSQTVPSGFLPDEDQGYVIAIVILPDGASLDRTQRVLEKAEAFYRQHPATANVVTLGGYDILAGGAASSNAGVIFVPLKPFEERRAPGLRASDLIADSRALFGIVDDGIVLTINPPAIQGLGSRAGFTVEVEQRGGGTAAELAQVTQDFVAAASKHPDLAGLTSTMRVGSPQVFLDLDREKTQLLGIRLAQVLEPLQAYFGSIYVNDFNRFGRIWRVVAQAESSFRDAPQDVERIHVRNDRGEMVPLSSVVHTEFRVGPNVFPRFNGYPAVEVTGAPAPGKSSGAAMQAVREVAAEVLPPSYGIEWSSASYQEIKAGNQAPVVLAFGLMIVFLILAAQYERWSLPVAVLLGVPLAVLGALTAVWLRGYAQDLYFQVGMLTLVGLSAKNAVLIVEFCTELRAQGQGIAEAAINAARLRFRPIVMTSMAFILGVAPLAVASGAGAAGRRSIGTGVIGGMLAATFLAVFFVPLFYVLVETAVEWGSRGRQQRSGGQG
ncbi:MAG: efflux RND transporter permease subunit, partial [Planctomycetes bacterium]|nr:efflux RND transporter permease subunit [Planctomycetota bacterium]